MAVYSTNQNRQLYVANGVSAETTYADAIADIKGTLGKVLVGTDKNGCKFITQNGYGGLVTSDLIDPTTIMWANVSGPKDHQIKLKAFEIDFTQDGVDSSTTANTANAKPVSGEDYILRINFTQMYGMSDEDIYQKYGAVHATSSMKKDDFFRAMAYSLVKNFSRLYQPLVQIALGTAVGSAKVVARATKDASGDIKLYEADGTEIQAANANTKLYILEQSQVNEWVLGTKQYTPVYFAPYATTITNSNSEVIWGKVTEVTDTYAQTIPNGYKFADLEYFCMGERGDQYRMVGWPNAITTKYFVVPTNQYYCLDIHYAYQGTCEDIQKSEKTITVISTTKKDITDIVDALGIGTKVHETDLFDGTAGNATTYPTASLEERVATLEG